MSDKSQEQLIEELTSLRTEVAELKKAKIAFDAQNELLKASMLVIQTATGSLMLKTVLQQALTISSGLTTASEGSLFLLSTEGVVIESILARGATVREQKQTIIGKVLDKGLAGWVIRNRQVGLIKDTVSDERWINLPNQPYVVRSVLCIPILKGKTLLGIITLMHSEPEHFTSESVQLIQMIAAQIVLVLDHARLNLEREQQQSQSLPISEPRVEEINQEMQPTHQPQQQNLSELGMFIIIGKGKFLYANPQLAKIFGYSFGELVSLESILTLVSTSHLERVTKYIVRCLEGKHKSLSFMFKGRRKDASALKIELFGNRTKFYGKSVIIGVLREVG